MRTLFVYIMQGMCEIKSIIHGNILYFPQQYFAHFEIKMGNFLGTEIQHFPGFSHDLPSV